MIGKLRFGEFNLLLFHLASFLDLSTSWMDLARTPK